MIRRASLRRIMLGLEPVIQLPAPPAQVWHGGYRFEQAGRWWLADPWTSPIARPSMADVAGNPVLPPWTWPDEIVPVPYPAAHRPLNTAWWPSFGIAVALTRDALLLVHDVWAPPHTVTRSDVRFLGPANLDALLAEMTHAPLMPPVLPVAGDEESHVAPDTIEALVDLAKQDRHADFVTLAGAVGVPKAKWDALWRGTRARLPKEAKP